MIVVDAAVRSVPVSGEELGSVMTRRNPTGSHVRRPGPITRMPHVTTTDGVPVAVNPHEFGSRPGRKNANDSRPGWRTDSDAHGNLGGTKPGNAGEQHGREQHCFHGVLYERLHRFHLGLPTISDAR